MSKCSNIISHRSSKVDTLTIDLRWSTRWSSFFEGRYIDLQRSTHRSSKVDTSIFVGRHIDLRRSTHRSSKTEGGNIAPTIRHWILSTRHWYNIRRSLHTPARPYVYTATATPRVTLESSYVYIISYYIHDISGHLGLRVWPHTSALVMYYTLIYVAYRR